MMKRKDKIEATEETWELAVQAARKVLRTTVIRDDMDRVLLALRLSVCDINREDIYLLHRIDPQITLCIAAHPDAFCVPENAAAFAQIARDRHPAEFPEPASDEPLPQEIHFKRCYFPMADHDGGATEK